MAHLTKLKKYDIKDSNIALLGSDLEKRVREHAGDKEPAWTNAGLSPGIQIWRIEKFTVVPWPEEKAGSFYDGDSYIILHTYKKTPEAKALSYDLHFWLGEQTTQDEAGCAAFKTVELDDHLHGLPIEYREVQGSESDRFLSYFPRFVCLKGGVDTGFHHVVDPPPLDVYKLYRIIFTRTGSKSSLVVREVPPEAASLVAGDVYVLDKGTSVLQFNTKASAGQERFKAAEFVQTLVQARKQCGLTVYDEGGHGAGLFLTEFGEGTTLQPEATKKTASPILFRLSDSTGVVQFEQVRPVAYSTLSSLDAFLLDDSANSTIYVWIGKEASLNERRLAPQYAQNYLYNLQAADGNVNVAVSIIKMLEGNETEEFVKTLST